MNLQRQHPQRPYRKGLGQSPFEMKLVNPANKRKYDIIVVGSRTGRRFRRGHAGGAWLQRQVLLLSGFAAPRAFDRRAGRHQRREKLSERRRQHLSPVLRHRQRRRLPRARSQRLPSRADQRQHHRPVRRAGRAVRAGIRRHARQSKFRRRAGFANLLRPRPDRPAAFAGRVSGARTPGRRRPGDACFRAPKCWTWW